MPDHVPDDDLAGAASKRAPADPLQNRFPQNRRVGGNLLLATVIITPALLTAVTTLAICFTHSMREPAYAGKTISEWLDGGYEPAALALQEVGPSAIPWLFKNLRREHPVWSNNRLCLKLRRLLPAHVLRIIPAQKPTGFDELRAANLLIGLGPSAVPALEAGLKDGNPAVRSACKMALSHLAPKAADERQPPP